MSTVNFVTYVICMPDDRAARSALTDDLEKLVASKGGTITGISMGDEMTLNELFEVRLAETDVHQARQEAARIASKTQLCN
ncbi:hypothetical protein [Pseudomonas caricapapayae]|uniref:hypothetical protein n=1 Tax=Pseudomonas caricapapayae TaxID=46678 RepID=UPI000F00F15F|nr:hypothetical protein [Pseudomonas caricapapayae]KAA8685924.1 hypothetical protein F4W67_29440 [Pseudomonas caricapapayae]